MKIAVVGAGVVGIACAHELSLDGHEVTVFERRSTVAEEASFASGALIAPGWTTHWSPAERQLGWPWSTATDGLQLARLPQGSDWSWLWQWRQAQKGPHLAAVQEQIHRLVRYNQERLQAITDQYQLEHDRSHGMLVLLRSEQDTRLAQAPLQQLRDLGLPVKTLTADEARGLEPALSTETALHSAVELGGEAVANCREFAVLLRAQAQQSGCHFEFNTIVSRVEALTPAGFQLELVHTASHPNNDGAPARPQRFDAVVMCTGAASAGLLAPLGLKAPLQTVRGHSLSAAVREPMDSPQSAVLDARLGVSIARLGQRVRVAGGREWGRESSTPSKAGLQRLYRALSDWFPGAVRLGGPAGNVQEWCGAQATLPDGAPLIGASRVPGLWLNLGHGPCGWSMACGSARVLADQVGGRTPELTLVQCSPQRYGI
ncbi:FAD-dependent oxidoreductase [Hydrogenophaga sp.]|uniref:FAD-dependent oxidoreductase n=1 Tax=Hydrogenophaga sp. TaxID=1904254 RepID=UPI002734E30B|nr:FAD-dependent oxidoreductase [Hydrogenophaga sp.]MDP2988902.1 FAD-dependent oxidoreductase [Hydrogenophaga sp.]